ncbi:amino acid permease [Nocardia terpenica]|uniref:amino acid permease n=1 Tax=Nocardia terpenica TaxID=455432 RepID=UPI0018946EFD|nr:amino acid permease [Nocardia terpenica]MBF6059262.1 amino acid permease [Nocardia terpenica]MBF6103199.1 amino acid permease [Nocardia terpenica]MBF6110612.1 amino acid permease [Nocardia terpenica]MBF6116743.1 amino acid permease [Nocardia terpenica]
MTETQPRTDDERRLAEPGYRQDLARSWSGFSNFAVSFTIVSILTGGLASYGIGLANGGPITMAWGWPLVSVMVLFVGAAMAELASAYPTSGGLYWWASELGGPVWGWFTGWFNLIGQIAVTAAIDYGAAIFTTVVLNVIGVPVGTDRTAIFSVFAVVLVVHAVLNIVGPHLSAVINNVSAWWHVGGVAIFVLVLGFGARHHQSVEFVFTKTVDNSAVGFGGVGFSFLLGLLHAQYTFTGYDASAHMSEETRGAARAAAKGIIHTIVVSAIAGYLLILAVTFAIPNLGEALDPAKNSGYPVIYILQNSLSPFWSGLLLIIAAVAQLFCGYASVTSASRMLFAFARDGAVPGSALWSRLSARKVPVNAVVFISVFAFALLIPSMLVPAANAPTAYAAATSVATIGLYIAYGIPILLRQLPGSGFHTGPWHLGSRYRPIGIIALLWIVFISLLFILPTDDRGYPWHAGFTWTAVNYAPLTLIGVVGAIAIWWFASARHWFTGPKRMVP